MKTLLPPMVGIALCAGVASAAVQDTGGSSGRTSGTSPTGGGATGVTTSAPIGGTNNPTVGLTLDPGTREPWDQPFSSTSVWNTPIGSGAQWSDPATDAGTAQLITVNGVINAGNWGQPVYVAGAGDPVITVTDTDTDEPIRPQTLHSPIDAIPAPPSAAGGDHHMAWFDLTQPTNMFSYYACSFNNGNDVTGGVTCRLGGVWDACGDGVTNSMAPGSDYNFAIGTIRHWELQAGKIQHVLRYSDSSDLAKSPGPTWTSNIPWPNTHEDLNGPNCGAADGNGYCGTLDAGLTLGIPASVNLNSLGLSQGGMMIATALQQYGAIWRDSGGHNQITFYAEPQDDNDPLVNQARGDMNKIVPLLRVLLNQGPNSINGGGTPLVTGPPPIDPTYCPSGNTPH
jgi:hypothetical protein